MDRFGLVTGLGALDNLWSGRSRAGPILEGEEFGVFYGMAAVKPESEFDL